ncbi:MAG: threonine aldolase family protein [Deltaproteobacteria bacterium]|nr:threonine aldolase family protein [Deltaproteobacteria bacterium]
MNGISIDLYSDTITKPTPEMRKFMSEAEVGDEQQKEDPTVNALVQKVCELLEKEDAIFLPSGTMCNQVAFRVHCRPGDEILMDETAHARHYETGGPSALSGACIYPIQGKRGVFSPTQMEEALRPENNHFPRSRVVLVEQTSNLGGGTIWPIETIRNICITAHHRGLACHMDGARLLNAVVATGLTAAAYCLPFDSVWIDFSKGLGAPVGAALAGSREFIREAWRWKHQFGGAMRQAGIIAAGALYALHHNVERIAEDHENARILARGLAEIEGIDVEPIETNLIFFDVSGLHLTAQAFNDLLMERGVRVSILGKTRCRAVTHLDVSRSQVQEALKNIRALCKDLPKRKGGVLEL